MITSTSVAVPAPFDFDHTLAFVEGFSPMAGEQRVDAGRIRKAVSVGGQAVVYRVSSSGERERPRLEIDLVSTVPLRTETNTAVVERIATNLGARDDLGAFYALAAEDRPFEPLTRRYRGLRHVRFPSPFEAACWGVINQRIQLPLARRMKDALTRRAGPALGVDGVEHRAFPEPDAVARLGEDEIGRIVPGRRGRAVWELSRAFGLVDERFLREAPIAEVRSWLRAIHGVGPFTSGFVLYRALGRFDGAGIVSPKLLAAAGRVYGRGFTADDLRRHAGGYGPWGGYWMLYLWASTFVESRERSGEPFATCGV